MSPINSIRLVRAALLTAVVAVCVVPNAAFGKPAPRSLPDAFERYVTAHPYGSGVIDTGQAPDVFERYVKSHGFTSTVVVDGRSPDTLDAAQNTQLQVPDGRAPDTRDAQQTVQPVEIVTSGGFDWADAGIGAVTGGGLILVLSASLLLLQRTHRRHHVQAT